MVSGLERDGGHVGWLLHCDSGAVSTALQVTYSVHSGTEPIPSVSRSVPA